MNSNETVLVVIPCYNGEQYLSETLDSIKAQSHHDWVVVLADNASTDSSAEIFSRYQKQDPRFNYVRLPENTGGPAGPRNRAIEFAVEQGLEFSFVAYLDADDLWCEHKLEQQLRLFRKEPGLGFVYSEGITYFNETRRTPMKRRAVSSVTEFLFFSHITLSSVMLRRTSVERFFPLFDTDPELVAVEDAEAWVRLMSAGVLPVTTSGEEVLYRVHAGSVGSQGRDAAIRRMMYLYGTLVFRYRDLSVAVVLAAMISKAIKFYLEDLSSFFRGTLKTLGSKTAGSHR